MGAGPRSPQAPDLDMQPCKSRRFLVYELSHAAMQATVTISWESSVRIIARLCFPRAPAPELAWGPP